MDKQAEIARIKAEYEARNKEIERQHRQEMAKIIGGGLLSIGSAFIPGTAGLKVAGALGKTIAPMVGKKIGTEIASGLVSGGLSGAVEGVGRGLIENKNPLKTMATDSLAGGLLGGLGGYGLGKVAQKFEQAKLPNNTVAQEQYFNDYVADLNNKTKAMADFRAGKLGMKNGKVEKAYDLANDNTPLTETEAFKNWFGNSKVVDENGNPKVVYHGSFNEFDTFDKSKQSPYSQYGGGFFFADDYDTAKMYGDNVYPVYLKAETNLRDAKKLEKTKDHIYDKNRGIWVVYEPEQIKSVNNQGTFDPSNPNIYKSILAPIGAGAFANRLLNEESNNYN